MRIRERMMAVALALMSAVAGGQTAGSAASPEVMANGGLLHTLLAAPVIGEPYSAIQVHKTKRVLANGATIAKQGYHSVARDSAGRVRVERRMEKAEHGQPESVMVFVLDPVAHTMMVWMTGAKSTRVATLIRLPEQKKEAMKPAEKQARSSADSRPQPVVTTENLGTDALEGVPVTMTRTTTVMPVGMVGNDVPLTRTHETWTSTDMKLVMKEQWEDPRLGVRTVELDQFSRAEPDAALFRAPTGYTVKDIRETLKELEERLEQMQN